MNQKLSETKRSIKIMWGCAALILVAVIVAIPGHAYALLFLIPCMAMMMWMMMGDTRSGKEQP